MKNMELNSLPQITQTDNQNEMDFKDRKENKEDLVLFTALVSITILLILSICNLLIS